MVKITDLSAIVTVLAYCNAQNTPCYAIHTPPESTIGGFSCALVEVEDGRALVEIANGDTRYVPVAEIHLRGKRSLF